jgi:hypothetical protein
MATRPPRPQTLWPALLLLALVFALTQMRSVPPAPLPADAPADRFAAGRARDVLEKLVGDGVPHPIGSEANARVREKVIDRLQALGYQPDVQGAFTCAPNGVCATVRNVVARLAGRERGKAVLVVTHLDSVWAGPGASDDGVSVAIVLEVARALKQEAPRRNPVILLIDDGEEAGLLGAAAFAARHPDAAEVGAVVNLEARGTSGQSVMFETSRDNAWLVRILAAALPRPAASSLFHPIYERLPNDTDLTVFKRAGMPGVNFAFIGDVPKYHTPLDTFEHASPRSLQHQGENALAVVRALAEADLAAPPGGDAVFFDLLGLALVWWRAPWTPGLAVAAFVLVTLGVAVGMRRHAWRWSRVAGGLALWLLTPAAGAAVAYGLTHLLSRLGAFRGGATSRPVVATAAFWLLGIAVATALPALTARRIGRGPAWAGCWLGWALLGLAAAFSVREASYIAIVPALVAGLAAVSGAWFIRDEPGWLTLALPMVAAAVLWMSPAWFLFDALGVPILPAIGGVVAVMFTPLAPFFAEAARGWRWGVPGVATVSTIVFALVAWSAPSFSADRPEHLNLTYFQEDGGPGASWIAAPQSRALPAAMRDAASFGGSLERPYPWSASASAFVAPAPAVEDPAPDVQVLARARRDGLRIVRVRIGSPRGARVVALVAPADRVRLLAMNGHEISRRTAAQDQRAALVRGPAPRMRTYACLTAPQEGIEV